MPTPKSDEQWFLEVVRGVAPGRRHPLREGETLLGNALQEAAGIDLADQEPPGSPRRMAGRQASLTLSGRTLSIRDLESPGGTFVNRQRLFVGQGRTLQPGDVIQAGSVQLLVKREPAASLPTGGPALARPQPASPRPVAAAAAPDRPAAPAAGRAGALSPPYAIAGATCRTWDDFLTLAAQRWTVLREELTSGRLSTYLRQVGRADLVPRLEPATSPDDQLDAWLGRLPATTSSAPELDVHPQTLTVRSAAGGGTVRQTLRITNVGYRLLRTTARVEAAGTGSIRLMPPFNGRPFLTIEQTEIPLEIDLPESPSSNGLGAIVLESNGGSRRVEVRLERPAAVAGIPEAPSPTAGPIDLSLVGRPLLERLGALPLGRRLAYAAGGLLVFRLLILLACQLPLGGPPVGGAEARLNPIVLVLAAAGFLAGLLRGAGAGEPLDRLAAGFAGAVAGVFAAAIGYAAIRSGESLLGPWAGSTGAVLAIWACFGLALAALSWFLWPGQPSPAAEPSPITSPGATRAAR